MIQDGIQIMRNCESLHQIMAFCPALSLLLTIQLILNSEVTNGGLNQMHTGICDMVAVARTINATHVIPELDKKSFWQDDRLFGTSKTDSRWANNKLPSDIQKFRCRTCFEALRFSSRIEQMGKILVERIRSFGHYI
ncbi:O-fucosyltransferase 35-like [Arachis stenosperma]|uniref:O-fucosyltransferase 35-like n=1 Tax=Arachis stenosperma TaxID=217475 RepID=UPI0025ACC4F6|nr:O-fucosyltransferase 35-like [Arachis stenosperma]